MPQMHLPRFVVPALLAGTAVALFPDLLHAQTYVQNTVPVTTGYNYSETQPTGQSPLLFGFAAYKLCEVKTFLFAGVYVLAAIAFVIFAVRALFTKFEMKHFVPLIGAVFIVASADLFIYWMSSSAYFCPTTLTYFSG